MSEYQITISITYLVCIIQNVCSWKALIMQKILIVENDTILANTLKSFFISKGYECSTSSSIGSSVELIEHTSFDLVVLDRVLDDGDGIEVLEFIHDFSFQTKVILLSDLKSEEQRVSGLEAGADDYLPKPFSLVELNLRVRKHLLTHKLKKAELLKVGDLSVNPETGEV